MIKVVGTYQFNVWGDGVETEMIIPLEGLMAQSPIDPERIPTELVALQVGASPGGGTVVMEDTSAHLYFAKAPPAGSTTAVIITALFGVERIAT
jgi:hypothetical protein